MPWVASPIGVQGNAWNNAAVAINGVSATIDTEFVNVVTIFGNVSAAVNPLNVQASQDGVNFYTVIVLNLATGNFGSTTPWGARYMRLQSGKAATITATIAGKD